MHTAQTSPRLGLMIPGSNDDFEIDDFVETMTILDNTPGVKNVANYAALNAIAGTLTTAQDNQLFHVADTGTIWRWIKPGSAVGQMKQMTTVGMLGEWIQNTTVSTTATAAMTGPTLVEASVAVPGTRNLYVEVWSSGANSASTATWVVDLSVNYGSVTNQLIVAHTVHANAPGRGAGATFGRFLSAANIGIGNLVTATARIRSVPGIGGTTSCSAGSSRLTIWEM